MSWITWLLALFGIAQQSPVVRDGEGKAVSAGLGLIKAIFDWLEEKEDGHPMLQAWTQYVEDIVIQYGADELVAFLAARGITITITKPPQDPPQAA
ncbi:MAG TPA: hypothetical protein VFE62_20975 [Gemmataceae bacterium]|nr:hypothetical protein [Gemmataceae bacterium]